MQRPKNSPYCRRSQCNVSYRTGESTKTVDAHIIKERSGKANSTKSPPIPLTPSSRQSSLITECNTNAKIKLELHRIFSLTSFNNFHPLF